MLSLIFLYRVIFIFPLFLGMVMYANALKQRKDENYLKQRINYNIQLYKIIASNQTSNNVIFGWDGTSPLAKGVVIKSHFPLVLSLSFQSFLCDCTIYNKG